MHCAWTLVRACRTGWIYSDLWRFNAGDDPIPYTLTFAAHIFCGAMMIAGAAGYSPSEFLDIVVLGGINSFCFSCRHS
jgi:hypothetical protein